MQPSCDCINGNDTGSSDIVSVTGVEKNPAFISSVNKNIDICVNDNSDNKVSVIMVDFGLVPPSSVSHGTYGTKGVVGGVGTGLWYVVKLW